LCEQGNGEHEYEGDDDSAHDSSYENGVEILKVMIFYAQEKVKKSEVSSKCFIRANKNPGVFKIPGFKLVLRSANIPLNPPSKGDFHFTRS
jgi:hypothetical protein